APPPTPSMPQQPSAPPDEDLIPEVFKPLVRHLFPEGLGPNNRAFSAPGSPDSPSPTNSAGGAGARQGLASTPSPLPSAASLPDFPIPAPLLPLLRLFAPREPTD